jgi:hypothetical protein
MNTYTYPGDNANPEDVAGWMAQVAKDEYALPGILPVMTSCVELTAAWTGPGDVKTVPGYLGAVDFDSLGYFQQRPSQGWGTPAQLTDANYALGAFCRAAAKFKDWEWNEDTTDAGLLGMWCQAVQRSAFPDAYRDKGYPMASKLLQASGLTTAGPGAGWPQRKIGPDKVGWIVDLKTNEYISTAPNITYRADDSGWLYAPAHEQSPKHAEHEPPVEAPWDWWTWDGTNPLQPFQFGDGTYADAHPTRYDDVWRADIEGWARYLVDNYHVWCNTYYDHPPEEEVVGYYDDVSFDVWDRGGRGWAVDPAIGQQIFNELFYYEGLPNISWIIWQGTIYHAGNGWAGQAFGFDPFTWHYDHIHVTYH